MRNMKISAVVCAVLIVSVLLSFAGCGCSREGTEPTVAPTVAPTEASTEAPTEVPTEAPTEPAPTEPAWEPGISKASYVEALYALLNKGDEVEVVGKYAHYFVISAEPYDLLVDEYYIRLETEAPFESWTGYARSKSPVFTSVYMREEPIAHLATNTVLTVLEGKDNWLFVQWNEGEGYMLAEDVSKTRIRSGGGGGGTGGGGGAVDGTDVDVGALSATTQQGGVVKLGYYGPEMNPDFAPCKGIVLAEEVEAYITVSQFADQMKVVSYDDEFCNIYMDTELMTRVRRNLVKLAVDVEEEPWTGYARSGSVAYYEYQRRTEFKTLRFNEEVTVLYRLPGLNYLDDGVYVVSIGEEICYMEIADISETRRQVYSGGGGGGSSGGDVWTPPAM